MTRKDYILLADAIVKGVISGRVLEEIAYALKNDNSSFDAVKWVDYIESQANERLYGGK